MYVILMFIIIFQEEEEEEVEVSVEYTVYRFIFACVLFLRIVISALRSQKIAARKSSQHAKSLILKIKQLEPKLWAHM